MKKDIKKLLCLPLFVGLAGLILTGRASAQSITNLHSFTTVSNDTNRDGANPSAGLILSNNTLYGTAEYGGSSSNGTVFKINIDGTGFTTLHSFTAVTGSDPDFTNSDGANPSADLTLSGNTLYGTAVRGGASGEGTIFKINIDGTGFTTLHNFAARPYPSYANSDGASPSSRLILSGDTLYGTAAIGGASGNGTVFKVKTDGTGFTTLHNFAATPYPSYANSDGALPEGGLILSGSTLYGTAARGGRSGNGTVFSLNIDGTSFTNLHSFAAGNENSLGYFTNIDGSGPNELILSGNTLYGTASGGGSTSYGTVFKITTEGAAFSTLHTFSGIVYFGNIHGEYPMGRLILSTNTLYGFARVANGAIFKVDTDGTSYSIFYDFSTGDSHGGFPNGNMILSGNTFYFTVQGGGSYGAGAVSSLIQTPTIAANPQSLLITNGYPAAFSVSADGTPPLYYQWQKNGINLTNHGNLSGSTGNSLILAATITNDAGNYTVIVTNTYGSITSAIAVLTLDPVPPSIQNQPVSINIGKGSNPQLSVSASGAIPLSYQWYFNGFLIAEATAATFRLPDVTINQTGNYTVVVSNSFGSVTSAPASVVVYDYPVITGQVPATNALHAVRGEAKTLSVAAFGTLLQYQWFDNYSPIIGATNSSLALSNITAAMDGHTYSVLVSNVVGTDSSTLTLYVDIAIRQLPTGGWQGIGYWPNVQMTYTINAGPPIGTVVYAIQEQLTVYPANAQTNGLAANIIVGAINAGGTFDAKNFILKWGPFFDDLPRTFTYVLTPPAGTTNVAQFSGVISLSGTNHPVEGDNELNLLPLHPADNAPPISNRININDLTAYGLAWKVGNLWPVEPNPIPIDYVTSAGFIWKQGESYIYDPNVGAPPLCWVAAPPPSGTVQPAIVSKVNSVGPGRAGEIRLLDLTANTQVCSMTNVYASGAPFTVTLIVSPASSVNVYAVEDQIPSGWMATNFNSGGTFDSFNNEIKWGPFFDNSARTLTYQVIPGSNSSGIAMFSGLASYDGVSLPISGVRQVDPGIISRPEIVSAILSGTNLVVNGGNGLSGGTYGVLMSTDIGLPLSQWTQVSTNVLNASGKFVIAATNAVDRTLPKRFYVLRLQ